MLSPQNTSNQQTSAKKKKKIVVARKPTIVKKYAGYTQKYNKKDGYVCACCNPDKVFIDRSNYSKHLRTSKHKKRQEQFDQKQKEIEIAVQTNIALAQLKMNITTEPEVHAPPPEKKEMFSVCAQNLSDCPLPKLHYGKLEHKLPYYPQQHWKKLRQELRPIFIKKDILYVFENGLWNEGLKAVELLNEFGRCYYKKTRHMMMENDLEEDEKNEGRIDLYLSNTQNLNVSITDKDLLWKCQTALEIKL